MIAFENVTKKFGPLVVVDRVSFQIGGGEFVSIVGPSGAGKSTLINLLIGAIKPSSGHIKIDDHIISELRDHELAIYRRRVGIVFQDFKLLPKKTVAENVAFALEVCGTPGAIIRKKVPEVLKIVGLQGRARAFPPELSGGELQRTGIARALVHNPALVIADEPTGNLDPKTGQEIINLLLDINQQGTTVILATHNDEAVNRIQRRVLRLENGKLVSDLQKGGYQQIPNAPTPNIP